ncbi:glycine cleavage system protein GcvH [bacterium]|nr:glycine cleavage system protein GcvH [bacterium]
MNTPNDLKYTKDHEWVKIEGDEAIIGITDYAQGELGDIVFIDLPEIGMHLTQFTAFGVIEAVKAAADMYAPISGEISSVNGLLDDSPELINKSPYEDGWIVKVKAFDIEEVETLMSAEEYRKLIEVESGD